MTAEDDLARFIRDIIADTDRMVRVMREAPGYKPPFRVGQERDEAFLRLDREQKSERQIALALHVTTRTVIRMRGRHHRLKSAGHERRPDSDRALAARLLEDGCSINEVARTLRVSTETITRWFPDAPRMSRSEGTDLGVAMTKYRRPAGLPRLKDSA